jgi:hypothetical protein
MNVSTKSPEPTVTPEQEQASKAMMAELEAELAGFNAEERQRAERADRANMLERTLSAVKTAEAGLDREQQTLAKLDAGLAALKKIEKVLAHLPNDVPGAMPSVRPENRLPDAVDDIGAYLEDVVEMSADAITQRRERALELAGRYERDLKTAREQLAALRK